MDAESPAIRTLDLSHGWSMSNIASRSLKNLGYLGIGTSFEGVNDPLLDVLTHATSIKVLVLPPQKSDILAILFRKIPWVQRLYFIIRPANPENILDMVRLLPFVSDVRHANIRVGQ